MKNIVEVKYQRTGKSISSNSVGMREMQERVFAVNDAQYILLKSPPASGKSRALMYVGLEKLISSQVRKVIVAVPERSIAGSFKTTLLTQSGFHSDWIVNPKYNLCNPGSDIKKVELFKDFMMSEDSLLICTHSTLRFAFSELDANDFDGCLIGVDEFHHVSSNYENKLGELVRILISNTTAHILAMTGSYFRGDSVPILDPQDESKFQHVTYNYYEQLNGYDYLKSLGLGFHFYSGKYTKAVSEVLDLDKKTIIHIPSVNSSESEKDKYFEVDKIFDVIGEIVDVDPDCNIYTVETRQGKLIKVADLVYDKDHKKRDQTLNVLRDIKSPGDIDLILALGMAKEGFDWNYCEHVLTVGYRGSLTEIIQIIGRATRDCIDKEHAQFTNLVAEPDVDKGSVTVAVNDILKAITAALLMEQVLAPTFKYKAKKTEGGDENSITIGGYREIKSSRSKEIVENDLPELKASILQNPEIQKAIPSDVDASVINSVLVPKIVKMKYPHLDSDEVEEISQYVVVDSVLKSANVKPNKKIIEFANKLINVEDLNIDLIYSINPFLGAYEIMSKSLNPRVFKAIQDAIQAFKVQMTDDEAIELWPKINDFIRVTKRHPSLDSLDPSEQRLAEAIVYLKSLKRQYDNE
jgi:hypothetical protein